MIGLRVLSLKVKEIVVEKKVTTYKEVAETLIDMLNLNPSLFPLNSEIVFKI